MSQAEETYEQEAGVDCDDFCYICFGINTADNPLQHVCRCPTRVHLRCVARWSLYCAGKPEERQCRFCAGSLPDWKQVLTPSHLPKAVPVLSIYYNNQCVRMKVKPGSDGLQAFLHQLEGVVGRDINNVNFVFRCRCPDTGAEIFLQGLQAFEAAMHCACVRAAQRMLQQARQQPADGVQSSKARQPASASTTSKISTSTDSRWHAARSAASAVVASGSPSSSVTSPAAHSQEDMLQSACSQSESGIDSGLGLVSHAAQRPTSVSNANLAGGGSSSEDGVACAVGGWQGDRGGLGSTSGGAGQGSGAESSVALGPLRGMLKGLTWKNLWQRLAHLP